MTTKDETIGSISRWVDSDLRGPTVHMMGTVRVTAGEFPAARNKAAKVLCATVQIV